jgi:MFS family permease
VQRPRATLALAVAAQAAVSVIQFGLPAVGLDVRQRLDLGPAGFGVVFACLGVGSALALVPVGVLVDRLGPRAVVVAGGLVASGGDLGAAFASSAPFFACAALLAGIGGAAVPVAGMTSLLRGFPPERRGLALGWRQLAVPLGGTIGSFALPALTALGGLRLAFVVAAVACAATAFAFAAVAGTAPVDAPTRLSLDGVLRIPGMGLLLLLGLFYATALGGPLAYLVPAARDARLSAAVAGGLFTLMNVTAAAARLVWGRAADRRGGTRRIPVLRATGFVAAAAA